MPIRLLVLIILTLVALLVFFLMLVATDTALSVWQRLQEAPMIIQLAYASLLMLTSVAAVWLAWRWMRPGKSKQLKDVTPTNAADLKAELVTSANAGVDVKGVYFDMKLVTYNIRFGLGKDHSHSLCRIADSVRGADVIALSDILPLGYCRSTESGL